MSFSDHMTAMNSAIKSTLTDSITLAGNQIDAVVNLNPAGYDVGGGMLVDKTDPSVDVLTSDLALITVARGDTAVIYGANYVVTAIEPDDNGWTPIMLRPV